MERDHKPHPFFAQHVRYRIIGILLLAGLILLVQHYGVQLP